MTTLLEPLPDMRDIDITKPAFESALMRTGRFAAEKRLAHPTSSTVLKVGHRHFEVGIHEALLIVADECSGLFTTQVVLLSQVKGCQEIAWRFTGNGKPIATIWLDQNKRIEVPSSEALGMIGAFLSQENLTRTLTVQALPISIGAGQILREFTNTVSRIQMTTIATLQPGEEKLAASWQFSSQGAPLVRETCWLMTHKH